METFFQMQADFRKYQDPQSGERCGSADGRLCKFNGDLLSENKGTNNKKI